MYSIATLVSLLTIPYFGIRLPETDFRADLLSWQCSEPQWVQGPTIVQNVFKGALEVSCDVGTSGVLTYEALYPSLVKGVKDSAQPLHEGPTEEEFEGLPSNYLDITTVINQQGLESVRSGVHLAWDKADYVVEASFSKEIKATGFAANITKLDTRTSTKRQDEAHHKIVIWNETHVKKPPLVPINIFKSQVMDQMNKTIRENEEPVIKDAVTRM